MLHNENENHIRRYLSIWSSASVQTCSEKPALRDMTIAHRLPDVAIEVTWKPSFHFLFIHLNGKESLTLYDCCVYGVPGHQTYYIRGPTKKLYLSKTHNCDRVYITKRKRTKQVTGNSDDRCISRVLEQILFLLQATGETLVFSFLLFRFTFQAHSSGYIINYKI
jgi:hypothetical protein